jgi:hypothetical protein
VVEVSAADLRVAKLSLIVSSCEMEVSSLLGQKTQSSMADKDIKLSDAETKESKSIQGAPLIFISHDTRDADLAEAFARLLSSVSCGMLKSFRSSDKKGTQGIEYGLEWYPQIMGKLNTSSGVVCLLTERSLNRPWILYEAGVAKGRLETPVYGIALGITLSQANTGPFAQFQNCDDDNESLTNLVLQLLSRIPNSEPDREAVMTQVESFNAKKKEILAKLGEPATEDASSPDASVAKLFEEVKLIVQDLPSKVEGRLAEAVAPARSRRFRRFHPGMFDEVLFLGQESGSHIGLLMLFSAYRDDLPWLYDMGRELYESLRLGRRAKAEGQLQEIMSILELFRRHPMFEDVFVNPKEGYAMIRDLSRFVEHYFHLVCKRGKASEDTGAGVL